MQELLAMGKQVNVLRLRIAAHRLCESLGAPYAISCAGAKAT